MDKDRIGGSVKEGMGKVEEEWGRATNDPDAEVKGEERQVEGKVQRGWGEAKDTARDTVRDVTDGHDADGGDAGR